MKGDWGFTVNAWYNIYCKKALPFWLCFFCILGGDDIVFMKKNVVVIDVYKYNRK